jgi:hypothetical protein
VEVDGVIGESVGWGGGGQWRVGREAGTSGGEEVVGGVGSGSRGRGGGIGSGVDGGRGSRGLGVGEEVGEEGLGDGVNGGGECRGPGSGGGRACERGVLVEVRVKEVVCGGASTESEEDTMGLEVVDAGVEAMHVGGEFGGGIGEEGGGKIVIT